jgi:hypothetical protein
MIALAAAVASGGCVKANEEAVATKAAAEKGIAPSTLVFYELEVVNPGTKSQGVRGRLFDRDGVEVDLDSTGEITAKPSDGEALEANSGLSHGSIETNFGRFIHIPCRRPWDVCGLLPDAASSSLLEMNNPAVSGPTLFRLRASALCTRSQRFAGELLGADGIAIPPGDMDLATPMGMFTLRLKTSEYGVTGWVPAFWREAEAQHGYWPCR